MSYPQLAIEYFDMEGRAEVPRAMCWINDVPFEDIRLDHATFAAKKASLPLGQVPVAHVDGKEFPQSQAIYRYFGKLTNYYPQDPLEALRVDVVAETVEELLHCVVATFKIPAEEREAQCKKLMTEKFPIIFKFFEKTITAAKETGSPFIANGKFSLADLVLYINAYGFLMQNRAEHLPSSLLEAYPIFLEYIEGLKQTEPIQKYHQVKAAQAKNKEKEASSE